MILAIQMTLPALSFELTLKVQVSSASYIEVSANCGDCSGQLWINSMCKVLKKLNIYKCSPFATVQCRSEPTYPCKDMDFFAKNSAKIRFFSKSL